MSTSRTLEDGRPILIDGMFELAYNVHGFLSDIGDPVDDESRRNAADAAAEEAFLAGICGEWIVDVEESRARSVAEFTGEPTMPVVLTMSSGGHFHIEAPAITSGVMSISVDISGVIGVAAQLIDDQLMFDVELRQLNLGRSAVTIAGIAIPGLEDVIGAIAKPGQLAQRASYCFLDKQYWLRLESETHTLMLTQHQGAPGSADVGGGSSGDGGASADGSGSAMASGSGGGGGGDGGANGSTQPAAFRMGHVRKILRRPTPVPQGSKHLCWAAVLACYLRILRAANDGAEALPIARDDKFPEYQMDAIIQRCEKVAADTLALDIKRAQDENKPLVKSLSIEFGPGHRLLGVPKSFDEILKIIYSRDIMKEYYYNSLTFEDLAKLIDDDRYILLSYSKLKWITATEPNPTWHSVVVYGYDADLRKLLIADSNGPFCGAIYLEKDPDYPNTKFMLTSSRADTV